MEFKSQIATSIEQSKRLLELGLKKETANMVILQHPRKEGRYFYIPKEDANVAGCPAWSLHRLLEMIATKRKVMLVRIGDDLFDTLIRKIRTLITDEVFNKDYLEEKL